MPTLLLDPQNWDLLVDAKHNIAVAAEPYSLSQDVASALKLAQGELWYNVSKGVPYFQSILGFNPRISQLKQYFEEAALSVPGIVKVTVRINSLDNGRKLSGTVNFTTQAGVDGSVTL